MHTLPLHGELVSTSNFRNCLSSFERGSVQRHPFLFAIGTSLMKRFMLERCDARKRPLARIASQAPEDTANPTCFVSCCRWQGGFRNTRSVHRCLLFAFRTTRVPKQSRHEGRCVIRTRTERAATAARTRHFTNEWHHTRREDGTSWLKKRFALRVDMYRRKRFKHRLVVDTD